MKKVKTDITLYQRNIRNELPVFGEKEYNAILNKLKSSVAFVFPEYFAFHGKLKSEVEIIDYSKKALKWLMNLSKTDEAKATLIFGGTLIIKDANTNKNYNTLPVLYEGETLTMYQKRRLYGLESEYLSNGHVPRTVIHPHDKTTWGLLICADVFLDDAFSSYKGCDYIAIPTSSPYKPDDTDESQKKRDIEIYAKGSQVSGAVVLKCCGTGEIGGIKENPDSVSKLQGRSLIVRDNKVLTRAPDINSSGFLRFDTITNKSYYEEYAD